MGDASALTLFLVRHAAHGLLGRVLCGRMAGVSLGAGGEAQALAAAGRLGREPVAAVFSSPLDRARETAGPIASALGLDVRISAELNEIECGEWTGRTFDELQADERWQRWNRDRDAGCPPAGEPMRDVQDRVATAIELWRTQFPGQAVVAVSHADVIKAAICRVLGLSLDRYGAFEIDPASITTLVVWQGGGKVLTLNERALPIDSGSRELPARVAA